MDAFWAMSLPGLVVVLIAVAGIDLALTTRRRLRGATGDRAKVAAVGFDALGLALAPNRRHQQEHDAFLELSRDEDGDAAPPRSRVDLDSGVARIVVPPRG